MGVISGVITCVVLLAMLRRPKPLTFVGSILILFILIGYLTA